ncbi:MAG: glycosyltransferase family 2 protein [Dehalococcoidia bacterium]
MNQAKPDLQTPPLVSVVIAARNEAAAIEGCLEALACQTHPADRIEVLLADGASTDGTVRLALAYAEARGVALRVLQNERRDTPSGFNLGIEAARGEVIVILGVRARVGQDFVRASVAALRESGADAVGGVVRTTPGGDGAMAEAIALAQRSPFGVGDAGYRYAGSSRWVDTINYGAYRRAVFERVGLFDESMQWVEDDELNYRLREAGGRLWLDPAIEVEYRARASLGALWQQRFRWGLNKLRVARKHPGQMRPRHAAPAAFMLALAGSGLLSLIGGRWRWPLAALAGAYTGTSLAATLRLGARNGWPRGTALLPVAFATMHLGYGSGTLLGFLSAVGSTVVSSAQGYGSHDREDA